MLLKLYVIINTTLEFNDYNLIYEQFVFILNIIKLKMTFQHLFRALLFHFIKSTNYQLEITINNKL